MRSMGIDRRSFLAVLAIFGLGGGSSARAAATTNAIWLSANASAGRQYGLGAFDHNGNKVFEVDLPGRGHGVAIAPDRRTCVAVARRPGTFAAVVDIASGEATHWLETPEDRHFHGHGQFSADGRLLFTSENDYLESVGVIGIWDTSDWRRVGEMSSYGIEPHDLRLLADGTTLVVANGGIITHPDSGRARLNLDRMESSMVYLDSRDGSLLGKWKLPDELRLLSMRHFDVSADGTVAIGMQHQSNEQMPPIVGLHRFGSDIRLLEMPDSTARSVHNYCGSIAMSADGVVFAASCPQGSLVTLWETVSGRYLGSVPVADGCGLASGFDREDLIMTSGRRGVWRWTQRKGLEALSGDYVDERNWDNHATRLD